MANKNKKKKKTKGENIQKEEASSSLAKELELLKSEHTSLVCKYESLAKQYAYAIKSFSCVATVDRVNGMLEAKLEKLTSEHMTLQVKHKELECSHEKLVDSYATLDIAHEVVLSLVQFMQPLTHTCTCSHVNIELSCTKPCLIQANQSSIEHVFVESCDDLIAQENDELMKEIEKLKKDLE